jgi:hypothetical protein
MEEKCEEIMETKGMGWRVSLSILVGVGWLVFVIYWLFFMFDKYVWEKDVAIILLSLIPVGIILGIPWTIWSIKHRTEREKEMWKTEGFRGRIWLSVVIALVLMLFLVYWFWFLAEPYRWHQNLAVFMIAVLIMGGILGAAWAPWGMKHGRRFEKK